MGNPVRLSFPGSGNPVVVVGNRAEFRRVVVEKIVLHDGAGMRLAVVEVHASEGQVDEGVAVDEEVFRVRGVVELDPAARIRLRRSLVKEVAVNLRPVVARVAEEEPLDIDVVQLVVADRRVGHGREVDCVRVEGRGIHRPGVVEVAVLDHQVCRH